MIYEKLNAVQSRMKAPKNLYNSFGKYKYRNAEGILEAFKPYGKELGLVLMLRDSIEEIGNRVYVKATATLYDIEDKTFVEVYAYAREADDKKGMDASQVTGATSSYARKYCLNGLFLLDDTKDADTDEYRNENEERKNQAKPQKATKTQIQALTNLIKQKGKTEEQMLSVVGVKSMNDLTPETYNKIVLLLKEG